MPKVHITYAGVDVTSYPVRFKHKIPQGVYNFFEVPWNMSSPGHGLILVTSQQLSQIEAATDDVDGSELVLGVLDDANQYLPDETTTLKHIFKVQATQVWGESFRSGGVPDTGEFGDPDTPANTEGLWILEVQDGRGRRLVSSQGPPGIKTAFNVVKPISGSPIENFVENTSKDATTPWSIAELIEKCAPGVTVEGITPNSKLRDIFVLGIPGSIAADLILYHAFDKQVFKYDPFAALRYSAVDVDKDCAPMLQVLSPYRLAGGSARVYSLWATGGEGFAYKSRKSARPDYSDYYTPETAFPGYTNTRDARYSVSSLQSNPRPVGRKPYHALYRGFLNAALVDEYPVSLVRFCWANSVPTTEVHIGTQTPIRTLLEGPVGHFLRDAPTRVSIDGQIGLPLRIQYGFQGVIKLCNHAAGWAMVLPDGEQDLPERQIKVRLVNFSWHQGGDAVTCIPTETGYEIMDHIPIHYKEPVGAVDVPGTPRTACQDALPPGV